MQMIKNKLKGKFLLKRSKLSRMPNLTKEQIKALIAGYVKDSASNLSALENNYKSLTFEKIKENVLEEGVKDKQQEELFGTAISELEDEGTILEVERKLKIYVFKDKPITIGEPYKTTTTVVIGFIVGFISMAINEKFLLIPSLNEGPIGGFVFIILGIFSYFVLSKILFYYKEKVDFINNFKEGIMKFKFSLFLTIASISIMLIIDYFSIFNLKIGPMVVATIAALFWMISSTLEKTKEAK